MTRVVGAAASHLSSSASTASSLAMTHVRDSCLLGFLLNHPTEKNMF